MSRARLTASRASCLVATVLLAAAAPAAPPEPPRRIVLVSFDGGAGLEYEKGRAQPSPDGFRRAEREALSAERLQTVTP